MSFYFSANTIIYFLMRHEVDATEMDDVYLEQADDEFAEATPTMSMSPSVPTVVENITTKSPPPLGDLPKPAADETSSGDTAET